MDAAVYWAYRDEGAIQDDKREVESVLAQKGNESRKAREKGGILVACQVPIELHKKHSRPESCTCPRLAPVRFVVGSCRTCDCVLRMLPWSSCD
jgi:hypothetical protein